MPRWPQITDNERFDAKWSEDQEAHPLMGTPCWSWTAYIKETGYGQFRHLGRPGYAHRYSYARSVGPIPSGLQIDHLCRNRACVNPQHLEAVTNQENARRGLAGATTRARMLAISSCPAGHPYDEANTYRYRGHRSCRSCHRDTETVRRTRRKESRERAEEIAGALP